MTTYSQMNCVEDLDVWKRAPNHLRTIRSKDIINDVGSFSNSILLLLEKLPYLLSQNLMDMRSHMSSIEPRVLIQR